MKNFIEYYYNINIDELRTLDSKYIFFYNGSEYILEKCNNNTNYSEKYKTSIYLNRISDRFHNIILNRNKQIITTDGNNYYILFRINLKYNRTIDFYDILQFRNMFTGFNGSNNWKSLWEKKIDNFEYYIDYIQDKAEDTREFYDYFIGMGEVAISYLNIIRESYFQYSICHERINCSYTLYDLYNPVNIVFDHFVRDVSEYIKSCFFNDKYVSLGWVIDSFKFDHNSLVMLISRLFFPTFFFDLYEKDVEDKVLITKNLINKMNDYEKYIYYVIEDIKKRTNVPSIKWLNH